MRRSSIIASCLVVGLVLSQSIVAAAPRPGSGRPRASIAQPAAVERFAASLPASMDSDRDGWMDGIEAALGSDPASASSTPESLAVPESCMNAADDDLDGATDEQDAGCKPPDIERRTFPSAGIDAFDSTMELDAYDLSTPFGVCPLDFSGAGPVVIDRGDPVDLGGGVREVAVEMVAMQLDGTGTLAPGSPCNPGTSPMSFPVVIVEDPAEASTGAMTDTNAHPAKDFPADSFFDVFFLVDTPLGLLPGGPPGGPAGAPVTVANTIRSVPPYHSPGDPKLNPNCYVVAGLPHEHCPKPPLDHFKCYRGRFPAFSRRARLEDQFGRQVFDVLKPNRFCNPVSKNRQGIFDDGAHLKRYRIAALEGAPPFDPIDVLIQNQFGLQALTVVKPIGLFVPSRKGKEAQPAALDHFECYKIQGDPIGWRVRLEDQFDVEDGRRERARVLQPRTLCNPVEKTVEGVTTPIGDPTMHLVCYAIETRRVSSRRIIVRNQFGKEKVLVRQPVELCAPSLKTVVPETEIDVFPDSFAQVEIRSPLGNEIVNLSGPTTVKVYLGELADTDGDGREQVPTEIVQLQLQGTSTLFGPVTIQLRDPSTDPGQRSTGEIEELNNATPGVLDVPPFVGAGQAASFFDVFVEIVILVDDVEVLLHNVDPKRLETVITHKPPAPGETYRGLEPIGLYDEQGMAAQVQLGPVLHTPNPG